MVKFIAPDIPHAVILRVLNKLPVKSLVKFSCISKFWLNFITNDQGFNKSHFLESQKCPVLILTSKNSEQDDMNNLYYLEKIHGISLRKMTTLKIRHIEGYCNGLVFSWDRELVDFHHWYRFVFEICNLSRFEKISVLSAFQCKGRHEMTTRICGFQCEGRHMMVTPGICGFRFGYDCLSNEYKVLCVISYASFYLEDYYEYFIYTLGSTKPAWREIKHPWLEKCPASYYQWRCSDFNPPIFCSGTLFWMMGKEKEEDDQEEEENDNDELEEEEEEEEVNYGDLVSFDFHDEQFQVIKLPDDDEFVKEYNKGSFYQFEYKGCFCFASMKKFDSWSGDIELYILKEKVKQVWIKENISFDIPTEECDPAPPCNYKYMTFGGNTKGNSSTRIICSSNQIFLYWRRDSCTIHLYNVHSEELTEVKYPSEGDTRYLDYYISNHVENSLSLKAMAKRSIKEAADRYSERPTSTPALFFCP